MDGESSRHSNQESILRDQSLNPHSLPLQYLAKITNNFSDERILGKGGFSVVYLGMQEDGKKVAVKKLRQSITVQGKQFENEVDLLMRLKHPNIVRLLGYCYETQKLYTDYEPSLLRTHKPCFAWKKSSELHNWHSCYKVIEGICHGLHYLHEEISKPIIHLDLKPANILLDDNMIPKITDFGLSRILHQQQTIHTEFANGTPGYMPPEYINEGEITPKSDIFSLGVVIIEVITGHRSYPDILATSEAFVELELERWRHVMEKAPEYASLEMDCEQIKRCIQIGLFCVNPNRIKRPTTTRIINMLEGLESTDSFSEWLKNIDCHLSNVAASTRTQPIEMMREELIPGGAQRLSVSAANMGTSDSSALLVGATRGNYGAVRCKRASEHIESEATRGRRSSRRRWRETVRERGARWERIRRRISVVAECSSEETLCGLPI